MKPELEQLYSRLQSRLRELGKIAVAFSGGVDSTFLVAAAKDTLGDNVLALTVDASYMPRWEITEAVEFTRAAGIRHCIVQVPFPEDIRDNPPDRCYLCKKQVFTTLLARAREEGFTHLADGTNSDDTGDYRPGLRALAELNVLSPLKEAGLTKQNIRGLSREMGLPTWDKPAYACLLTRIPYDTHVSPEELVRIEQAESVLRDLGFDLVRVRSHGSLARIEVEPSSRQALLDESVSARVTTALHDLGYLYVTVDLTGYRTGSLNETLVQKDRENTE